MSEEELGKQWKSDLSNGIFQAQVIDRLTLIEKEVAMSLQILQMIATLLAKNDTSSREYDSLLKAIDDLIDETPRGIEVSTDERFRPPGAKRG